MPSSRSSQHDTAPTALPPKTGCGDDHDPRGRFRPGNRCGQGNPAAKQTAALRQVLRAAVTTDDITAIAAKLRQMALRGNLSAIRLLLSYVIGRPGAGEEEQAEPGPPPPETPTVAEEPAPVVGTAPQASADRPAVSPAGEPPTVHTAGARPAAPAPEAPPPPSAPVANDEPQPRPPSATAANGPATPLLPSATAGTSPFNRPGEGSRVSIMPPTLPQPSPKSGEAWR